jgi:hypothetical protein
VEPGKVEASRNLSCGKVNALASDMFIRGLANDSDRIALFLVRLS